jgi:hypothetical protein
MVEEFRFSSQKKSRGKPINSPEELEQLRGLAEAGRGDSHGESDSVSSGGVDGA